MIRHGGEYRLGDAVYIAVDDRDGLLLVPHPACDRPKRAVLTVRGNRIWRLLPIGPASMSRDYDLGVTAFGIEDLIPVGAET